MLGSWSKYSVIVALSIIRIHIGEGKSQCLRSRLVFVAGFMGGWTRYCFYTQRLIAKIPLEDSDTWCLTKRRFWASTPSGFQSCLSRLWLQQVQCGEQKEMHQLSAFFKLICFHIKIFVDGDQPKCRLDPKHIYKVSQFHVLCGQTCKRSMEDGVSALISAFYTWSPKIFPIAPEAYPSGRWALRFASCWTFRSIPIDQTVQNHSHIINPHHKDFLLFPLILQVVFIEL